MRAEILAPDTDACLVFTPVRMELIVEPFKILRVFETTYPGKEAVFVAGQDVNTCARQCSLHDVYCPYYTASTEALPVHWDYQSLQND